MKKVFLGFLLGISLLTYKGLVTHAQEGELLINSSHISENILEFAESNYFSILDMHLILEQNNYDTIQESVKAIDYKLGTPFTMVENSVDTVNTYFPIINNNNEIKYIYTVTKMDTGELTGSISEFMADELESIKESNSDAPITIYSSNKDVYVESNDKVEVLVESGFIDESEPLQIASLNEILEPVEVTEEIEVPFYKKNTGAMNSRAVSSDKTHVAIMWKQKEIQGATSWCAAVTLNNILYNKNTPIYSSAAGIITYTYPNLSNSERIDWGMNNTQVVNYARSKGLSPKISNAPISKAEIKNQLKNGNGIFMNMAGTYYGNPKARHAMAITGWAQQPNNSEFFWISNPWWNYTITTQANTYPIVVTVPGGYYSWDSTVYNF